MSGAKTDPARRENPESGDKYRPLSRGVSLIFFSITIIFYLISIFMVQGAVAHEASSHHEPIKEEERAQPNFTTAEEWVREGDRLMQEARNVASHNFSEAEAAYRRALALEEENPKALLGMGWVANSNHDFPAGKEWCEKALAIDPRLKNAYNLMGDGAVELGRYDEAFAHFQSAMDIEADLSTFSRAAHLLWLTGDRPSARVFMNRAIKAGGPYPENEAWCRAKLAEMHVKEGALPSARSEVEQALKLAPDNPHVLLAEGRLLVCEEKYEEALASFKKAHDIVKNHEVLESLVLMHEMLGQTKEAERRTEELLTMHRVHHHGGDHLHSHEELGSHQLALFLADREKQLDFALEQAKKCQKNFPNIHSEMALAWCYYQSGNLKFAQLHGKRAMAYQTPDPMLFYRIGVIEFEAGHEAQGKKHLAKALSFNPAFHPQFAAKARKILSGKME